MMAWLRKTMAAVVLVSFTGVAFADPPLEAGVVIRADVQGYFQWWYDFEKDITAYFGVDPFVVCTSEFPAGWDLVPIMEVLIDTDGDTRFRFKDHITGDLQTSLWAGFVFPGGPGGLCDQIVNAGLTPIANGYSRFKFNDNDVEPWLNPNRHNINSFGFNANGILHNYDTGEPMRFMRYVHGTWDGIDEDSFRSIVKTKLK